MSASSLSIFVASVVALLAMTAADSSHTGDLMNSYKHLKKAGSEKAFDSLLTQYKSDIVAHRDDDKKKLDEMIKVFLLSLDSCDETLPTVLAETLSYRIDLFHGVMQRIPDKQKPEFLHMLAIGVANVEYETTKPRTPKADAERVLKFKSRFEEYQKQYPRIK